FIKTVRGDEDACLSEIFQNDAQRTIVDKLTGVMSLLEGHADVVMDGVGPEVIPTVAQIRRKFTQRRQGAGPFDRLLRRLLGLEGKMKQYRDGAAFVRDVNDKVGLSGFNAVWEKPENLPTKSEITDPAAWVARVLS
ncbi:MAG TPA: zinc-dependent metalloprotease, partial [Aeromicrobium sp.]|nr:zinc-dependent metalloprotease [Aeromicrobium sp.]